MSIVLALCLALCMASAEAVDSDRVKHRCLASTIRLQPPFVRNAVFEDCMHRELKNNDQANNEVNEEPIETSPESNGGRFKRFRRQAYQTPQVDENIVSAFLNSPEAVKMVLSFLGKQNKLTTTATTPRPAPLRRQRPRPPPPPLSFFFGNNQKPLSELIQEHRNRNSVKTISEADWKRQQEPAATTAEPVIAPSPENQEQRQQLAGDLQFFGLTDFKPKSPHNLQALKPMRLKYTSAQEFPTKIYGRLVPMPR